MSDAFTPIAFLAGTAALAMSVPALTDTPETATARGGHADLERYAPRYHERYADQTFRYAATACADERERGSGAALDSLVGERETGAVMTACDRAQAATAARMAFDNAAPAYWRNPETGRRGVVMAGAPVEGYAHECRRAESEIFSRSGGHWRETVTLCRDAGGDWRPLD